MSASLPATHAEAADAAATGVGTIPSVVLFRPTRSTIETADSAALFAGRNVIVFALPGAFTPTCSSQHLPRYEELAERFFANSVDSILCVSVNDPFVMCEWAEQQRVEHVQLLSDGNGDFTRAMDLLIDLGDKGLGLRSRRYSMFVRDGRIEKMFVEADEPGDPYNVSDADTMLDFLAPGSPKPPSVVLFTKPGCPYCSKAIALLDQRGLTYHAISLGDAERSRVLSGVAGAATTPQVFINGHLIGDSEALERHLLDASGRGAS